MTDRPEVSKEVDARQDRMPRHDRYERLASLELLRRGSRRAFEPDLAIHRRLKVPMGWVAANQGVPNSSYLYDLLLAPLCLSSAPHVLDAGCGFGAGLVRVLDRTEGTGAHR
jgi:hypothetical protein